MILILQSKLCNIMQIKNSAFILAEMMAFLQLRHKEDEKWSVQLEQLNITLTK